ncbi:DUF4232 domain-containing protein [Streptomyces catenulae]|uniref:DUF4232 domain-containing protein n=1 Tax=Streptomyces catenulae TaxID=66875 RepID=A0ABV2YXG4_9ACTN|nr:DUF4232 domain-containing protein [Streptomyces catenulae]
MSRTTTLRMVRRTAAATLVAAAALSLTACQEGGSDKASAASSSSAATDSTPGKPAAGSDDSAQANGAGADKSADKGAPAAAGGAAKSSGGNSGGTERCHTDNMEAGWGSDGGGRPDMNSGEQQIVAVWLKNTGSSTCTLKGFPGVSISGTEGQPWDLSRSNQATPTVTLKPGAHTSFTFALLTNVDAGGKSFTPGMVTITPPNETQHFQLQWPFGGKILDQSGATHPGTFVNPVGGQ